jgi:hypothetical protein
MSFMYEIYVRISFFVIIIIIIIITFMQGNYIYIPETMFLGYMVLQRFYS